MSAGSNARSSTALRWTGYVASVLLTLFGAWWASFSGFLRPSQMLLYVTFDYWQGIGMAVLGALDFLGVLWLPRPYAWVPLLCAGAGLVALQLARFAVFASLYLNTDWWVVFTAVAFVALSAFLAILSRRASRRP